jgi:DNA primase
MEATLEDRVLLLLSIKEEGKFIGFGHIAEKVVRDTRGEATEEEVREVLDRLLSAKLAVEAQGKYAATEQGKQEILGRLKLVGSELNLSYQMVLRARSYYPRAAQHMLPFLRGRATSVVKVFSDPASPLRRLKPLFVRYARYKPKPVFITIEDEERLLSYVDAHAIDFIPYVHRLASREPDWFILDLDAGSAFKEHPGGFELLKIVTDKVMEVLEEYGVAPRVKFSGSRGMQVWSRLDNEALPRGDLFALYRRLAVFVQQETEKKLQELPSHTLERFYEVVAEDKPITTSTVAKKAEREDQVLVDWSSMKPRGDVRAPFSMHYKTGLISRPVERRRILDFDPSEAEPERVAERLPALAGAFTLELSDPTELFKGLEGPRP